MNWSIRSKTLKNAKYEENIIKLNKINLLNCAFKRSKGGEINSISWETIPYIYNANTEVGSSNNIISTWFVQFVWVASS